MAAIIGGAGSGIGFRGAEGSSQGSSRSEIESRLTLLEKQRDEIKKEKEENGSSLLDSRINSLEQRISNLQSRLDKLKKQADDGECQTCKNRKYKDESDDPGVSFKTAAKVGPQGAESAVRGHEYEHVNREQAKAAREDREVVSQSVRIKRAICPECGESYVAGGVTTTVTKAKPESQRDERFSVGIEDESKQQGKLLNIVA